MHDYYLFHLQSTILVIFDTDTIFFQQNTTRGHLTIKNVYCYVKFTGTWSFYIDLLAGMNLITAAFLPVTLIIICNTFIIVGVVKANRRRQEMTGGDENDNSQQMSVLLITVSVFALITFLPVNILGFLIYSSVLPENFHQYRKIFGLLDLLFYCNNAANFFLYCMFGSNFRRDLKQLIFKNG